MTGRKKMEGTGWGIRDHETLTITKEVEKKHPYYWRLNAMFGTRPSASLGTCQDTLKNEDSPQHQHPASPTSPTSPALPASPSNPSPGPVSTPASQQPLDNLQYSPDWSIGEEDIDPAIRDPATQDPASHVSAVRDLAIPVDSDSEDEISQPSKSISTSSKSSLKVKRGTRVDSNESKMDSVKRIMENRQAYEDEREVKKAKIDQQMQRERLEAENKRFLAEKEENRVLQQQRLDAEECLAHINASTTMEVAKIQADAQVRQFEFMAQMLALQNVRNKESPPQGD